MKGFTLWLTGLSGAGKTTIARILERELAARGVPVERLDGDVVRQSLTRDLGFSKEDRDRNIERVTFVAKLLTRNGVAVITAFISPYRAMREYSRREIGAFIEVYIKCSLEECIRRDVKGMYRKAMAGEIPNFTGVSDPYEEPEHPEIVVDTEGRTPEESAAEILSWLEAHGHIPAAANTLAVRQVAAAVVDAPAVDAIEPHGGRLVNRILDEAEAGRVEERVRSGEVPVLEVDLETAKEVENLATGLYSPLEGFLGRMDLECVLSSGRLRDGLPWTLPIVLDVSPEEAERLRGSLGGRPEGEVVLSHAGRPVALLHITETYGYDKRAFCEGVYGTLDARHPGVRRVESMGEVLLAGPIQLVRPVGTPFASYKLSPVEARALFRDRGWRSIVAFQTRNAPHLGHEYVQKTAQTFADGLFINPVLGRKKPGDFRDEVILRAYEVAVEKYYVKESTVLAVIEYEMRYAGPREAIHHAIMRKNLGCTHFVVGRDHAGVGSHYGPYDAQEIFKQYPDLGITPVPFREFFHCTTCGGVTNSRVCPHGEGERVDFSGTLVRDHFLTGRGDVSRILRPDVADAIRAFPNPFVE